jgi:hypothetical protein
MLPQTMHAIVHTTMMFGYRVQNFGTTDGGLQALGTRNFAKSIALPMQSISQKEIS